MPRISDLNNTSCDIIIQNHTLFPYYVSFVPQSMARASLDALKTGRTESLYSQFSLIANRIPLEHILKFCPRCANADLKRYGVAYWHVQHQLPYIRYCSVHEQKLCEQIIKRRTLTLPPQRRNAKVKYSPPSKKSLLFATMSTQLLAEKHHFDETSRVIECYLIALDSNGFVTKSGKIRQRALSDNVRCFWFDLLQNDLVDAIFCSEDNSTFPRTIFYQPDSFHHPIKHLLLIAYLFGGLSNFLCCYQNKSQSPLCQKQQTTIEFERVSAEKRTRALSELKAGSSIRQAAKKAKVSVGYTKSLAVQNGVEINRRPQQLFGHERKQILEQLRTGKSTQEIASDIGCSIGAVEQILTQHPIIKHLRAELRFFQKRQKHRIQIKAYLTHNPNATRNNIRQHKGASYAWCFKNDKVWLYKTLPCEIPRRERYRR